MIPEWNTRCTIPFASNYQDPSAPLVLQNPFSAASTALSIARAFLKIVSAVLPDDRAQGNAGIHIAREIEIPDRAAVRPPAGGLQLVNDLHGANLGSAAHCSHRQRNFQRIKSRETLGERASY